MVDVLVIIQLGFQQYKSYEKVKVPQIQFFDILLDIPVVPQEEKAQCNLFAVPGKVVDTPVDDRCDGPDSAENCLEAVAGSSDRFVGRSEEGFCLFFKGIFLTPSTWTLSPRFQRILGEISMTESS